MKQSFFTTHAGALLCALGGLLIICGDLLPANGDYQYNAFSSSQQWLPNILFIFVLTLILFAISAYCWFRQVRGVLFVLSLIFIVLALLWHLSLQVVSEMLRCFDVCPPGPTNIGIGFWFPIVGYLLAGIGLLIAHGTQRSPQTKAPLEPADR